MGSRVGRGMALGVVGAAALLLSGCPSGGGSNDAPAKGNTAGQVATGNAAPTSVTPVKAPAGGTPPAAAPAAAGPNGRSAVPSTAEWGGVGEVTVKGSSALGCETKMVREWLRVSCHGKNDTGGTPSAVTITKGGGRGDTFTFASGGVSSLVCPYVDGTDIQAEFAWTDKKKELVVSWPHGAPKPPAVGAFQ